MNGVPAHMAKKYEQFLSFYKELVLLEDIGSLISWDQETYMPSGEAEDRAEKQAFIERLKHEKTCAEAYGNLLCELLAHGKSGNLEPIMQRNVEEAYRQRRIAHALPENLVAALAAQASHAQIVWQEAREKNDWKLFEPVLQETVRLTREKADAYVHAGIGTTPYETLVQEFEWEIPFSEIDALLTQLEHELPPFVEKVLSSAHQPDDSLIFQTYNIEKQKAFSTKILEEIGFDLHTGRCDTSTHPFTASIAPSCARITTRFDEKNLADSVFSTIHEAGHGIYEQDIDRNFAYQPIGRTGGASIHESQSRFWECWVGREAMFWTHYYPKLRSHFPFLPVNKAWSMYRAVNKAKLSFIRVDADPLTYNLHILLRYKLEKAILKEGEKIVSELPALWNNLFGLYFNGIRPPDNTRGVLQDVHWSCGYFGYFPTYAIGNIISAQLYAALKKEVGKAVFEQELHKGNFLMIQDWLREKIHRHGRLYKTPDLVHKATGQPLSAAPFMDEVKKRYRNVYQNRSL